MEWKKGSFGYSLELPHGSAFVSLRVVSGKWEWSADKSIIEGLAHTYGFCYDFEEAKMYAEAFLDTVLKIEEQKAKEK